MPPPWSVTSAPPAGQQDAQRALQLAQAIGQPPGTAIYFAVDYDAGQPDLPAITSYFTAVRSQLDAAGYQVGIYGDGVVCNAIKDTQRLAQYSWLAESTDWSGSNTYTTWDIKQSVAHAPLCNLAGPQPRQEAEYENNQALGDFGGFTLQQAGAPQIAAAAAFAPLKAVKKAAAKKIAAKKAPAKKTTGKPVAAKKAVAAKKTAKKAAAKKSAKKAAPARKKRIPAKKTPTKRRS
jgi:hypothetical protein